MTSNSARVGKLALIFALVAALVYSPDPASSHRADRINGHKAGPIRSGKTTLKRAEKWFGPADAVKRVVVGCDVRLKRAKWKGRLVVFFGRGSRGTATESRILRRTVRSTVHGDVTVHTRKGLRVGDSRRKLKRLYPKAGKYRHRGKDWYILRSSPSYGRLEAAIEARRVTLLRSAPWEYC
ncbi:MAG: hypothetical protein M3279_11735 [Actinomycetota bacterium]|nr:hypothetical protein [Actinomycetota bacterium]